MKKTVFLSLFAVIVAGFVTVANGAARPTNTNKIVDGTTPSKSATATTSATTTVNASRSATTNTRTVSASRSATTPTSASTSVTAARSASVPRASSSVSKVPNVARSSIKQTVLNYGTGVNVAQQNTAINQTCLEKFQGCMDSFCMIDNVSGGRCGCSDDKEDLDYILAEIQRLDEQSYKMATEGVEYLEMGANADAANQAVQNIVNSYSESGRESPRGTELDMSAWNNDYLFEMSANIFASSSNGYDTLADMSGDSLFNAVLPLCMGQIPECQSEFNMLQLLYAQNIKSDCTAYENELKRQQTASAEKLAAAEKALRDAALTNIQTANKWDLGQCTVQFKNCMIDTGGCGEDFTNCVGIAAAENASMSGSARSTSQTYDIVGANTKISIYASTMDALESKKPLCMNVTDSCVAVKDDVWDTFLREVAPELKTAELVAESNLRTSCISNISGCFQKACLDTIDPNDPDGSYDLCLSRPETIQSLCRVEIEPCVAMEPMILDYVFARLSAMRVDACTTQVKDCLTDENICGKNYANCVGLDTDTIIRMCPVEKLVACQESYSEESGKTSVLDDEIYDELANLVQGIMLDIDSNFLAQCQAALDSSMINVCGSTENCNSLLLGDDIGAGSLQYRICEYTGSDNSTEIDYSQCRTSISQISDNELGRGGNVVSPFAGVINGIIYWSNIYMMSPGEIVTMDDYMDLTSLESGEFELQDEIENELLLLQNGITNAIATIESDPTVQYCMTGRTVQGMSGTTIGTIGEENSARFPALTAGVKNIITTNAIRTAKDNYDNKYEELTEQMAIDYAEIGERLADINDENEKDARREYARRSCISMAQVESTPLSSTPGYEEVTAYDMVIEAAAIAQIMTYVDKDEYYNAKLLQEILLNTDSDVSDLSGYSQTSDAYNYKESITSNFNWAELTCTVCTTSQNCLDTNIWNSKCKEWADPIESCKVIQY